MFNTIIFITNNNYELPVSLDICIISEAEIIDNNSLKYQNEIFYFDYLIFDDLKLVNNLNIKLEHKLALTNYDLQTSIENFFAIGKANNTSRDITEQLTSIFEFLNDN